MVDSKISEGEIVFELQWFANITNTEPKKWLEGTGSADYIYSSGSYSTITGLAGNDTIKSDGSWVSIDGDKGNDRILSSGRSVTVYGGKGDDTITTADADDIILYYNGDGNDVITNYDTSDVIRIMDSSKYATVASGNDVVIYVGNGSMTVKKAVGKKLNISGGSRVNYRNVTNTVANVVLDGLEGDDTINNSGNNVLIQTGEGNDYINNTASDVTIDAGEGDDIVDNYDKSVVVNGDAGNDSIRNYGDQSTVNAGAGNDTVRNYAARAVIEVGFGNDYVQNSFATSSTSTISGEYATINGGAGTDMIRNDAAHVVIDGGDDNDVINNFGSYSKVSGGDGADTIINNSTVVGSIPVSGVNSTLDGGAGDDYIRNFVANVSINGGAGFNAIQNNDGGKYSTVVGGSNVDYIQNYAEQVTIQAGSGNDSVYNAGANVLIESGADNDTVTNAHGGTNVTINVGEGEDAVDNYADNVTIDGGDGFNQLINSGVNSSVKGGAERDFIRNYGNYSTVDAGDGDNVIFDGSTTVNAGQGTARGRYSFIKSGAGTDSILTDADNITIDSGAGNDTIEVKKGAFDFSTDYNSISAGAGNDLINVINGNNTTILGGAGDDIISLGSGVSVIEYNSGDGNDLIYGVNSSTTLKLNGVAFGGQTIGSDSASVDVILTVGSNKVTLKKAAGKSLTLINSDGSTKPILLGPQTIHSSQDGESLTGTQFGDSITIDNNNVTVSAALGDDRIKIDKSNSVSVDGGTVAGAGADSIVIDGGSNNTINGGAGADSIYVFNTSSVDVDTGAETTIYASINVVDGGSDSDYIENAGLNSTLSGGTGADRIVNYGRGASIAPGAGNDTIELSGNLDGTTIKYTAGADVIITNFDPLATSEDFEGNYEGANENYTDYSSYIQNMHKFSLENASLSAYTLGGGLDVYLKAGNNNVLTLKDQSPTSDKGGRLLTVYADGSLTLIDYRGNDVLTSGNQFFNYKNGALIELASRDIPTPFKYDYAVENYASNVTINGGAGDDTITNSGSNVSIHGGEGYNGTGGNDSIINTGANVTILGGIDNDLITLNGSRQVLIYSSGDGNDSVAGFDESDTIQLTSGSISGLSVDGSDVILNVGTGSIRLTNVAGRKLTVKDASGNVTTKYYSPTAIDNGNWNTLVAAGEYNDTITNSGSEVTINADAGDDSINSSGESVSIDAGAGDDTIELTGKGSSTINYKSGDGNDVIITNFDNLQTLYEFEGPYDPNASGSYYDEESGEYVEWDSTSWDADAYARQLSEYNKFKLTGDSFSAYTLGSSASADELNFYLKSGSNIVTVKEQSSESERDVIIDADGNVFLHDFKGADFYGAMADIYGYYGLLYENPFNSTNEYNPYKDYELDWDKVRQGNHLFINAQNNVEINFGMYSAYTASNLGTHVKLNGSEGNDYIYTAGNYSTISGRVGQ